ncbi:hypothetical protein [Aeromonas veronii]|uniref:hypothetical protein n=1 Tax=Aeromonas veronii TaxID=654 RepID=UPI0030052F4B
MNDLMNELLGVDDVTSQPLQSQPDDNRKPHVQTNTLDFLLNADEEWLDYDGAVSHLSDSVGDRSASLYSNALLEFGNSYQFDSNVYDVCRVKGPEDKIVTVYWDHDNGLWKLAV